MLPLTGPLLLIVLPAPYLLLLFLLPFAAAFRVALVLVQMTPELTHGKHEELAYALQAFGLQLQGGPPELMLRTYAQ